METMTDRELLELAAVAAGKDIDLDRYDEDYGFAIRHMAKWWNPLNNDGDALRLAVKLEMRITIIGDGMCKVSLPDIRDFNPVFEHDAGGDTGKATCRAITRLAAEIGKAMKEAK